MYSGRKDAADTYTETRPRHDLVAERKLSNQQKAFAANVASGMPLAEAAKDAGYSPKSAPALASQLMKKAKVAEEVARIRAKAVASSRGSKAECLDLIWSVLEEAKAAGDRANFNRGCELWLKATGNLVHKQEIKTDQVIEVEWQSALPDEAEATDDGEGGGDDR